MDDNLQIRCDLELGETFDIRISTSVFPALHQSGYFWIKSYSSSSSSSLPLVPTGAWAAYKSSLSISILGQPFKLSPGMSRPRFSLQIVPPGVSWAAWLSLSLWVPGQGLTCGTGDWLSEGVSNPSPTSLEDFIFWWLLLGLDEILLGA